MPNMLLLSDVFAGCGVATDAPSAMLGRPVRRVAIDSRETERDDVFVALTGATSDGHDFVSHALERGALAAIVRNGRAVMAPETQLIRVDDPLTALQSLAGYWRAKFASPPLRVIGVTGSIGKTTSKELIAQVLGMSFNVLRSEGNRNNEIGLPLTLLQLKPEHERAVLEMGMFARGEIAMYCELAKPHVGVVTMIAPVHLERLGSIENIVAAKAELLQALPSADDGGVAVLNDDDARVRDMRGFTRARVVTYGLTSRADVWADEIESFGLDGISFRLHSGARAWLVRVPLLGTHSVHTALRAAAVGWVEGLSWDAIIEGLSLRTAQLRISIVEGPRGSLLLDDTYNASAESTLAALNLLEQIDEGPRVAVLGDMLELGSEEERAHREVGCRAALVAREIVCVGERANWIADEAIACGAARENVHRVATNAEAVALLRTLIREKCVVLVKGSRGMTMEDIVQDLAASALPKAGEQT